MYKRILVPLDGSPLSEAVLPHAQALAKSEGAEIILLRMTANPVVEFFFSDPAIEKIEYETNIYIEALLAKLETAILRVSFLIRGRLVAGRSPTADVNPPAKGGAKK